MGKTLEELFKSKLLDSGKTAKETYEIRNSKDLPISPGNGLYGLPFKAATAIRQKVSAAQSETFLEEEVSGLRVLNTLSAPITYGTDIIRLSKKTTKILDAMKDGANPNNSTDAGIVGNFINKAEKWGLQQASKLGISFPETTIPTRVSINPTFKAGKEPDTMITLAKIKGDSAGTLVGQFLAKNVKGTPNQIANAAVGAGIDLLKGYVKKKLFGAPKQGAQNLAKKGEAEVQYDSSAKYSNTVSPNDADYFKRNDLSSILVAKETKELGGGSAVINKVNELVPKSKGIGDSSKNPFAKLGDKLNSISPDITAKLSEAKKSGQQAIADGKSKIGDTKPDASAKSDDSTIKYSSTVDAPSDDIKLRNDLSTKLAAIDDVNAKQKDKGGNVTKPGVPDAPADATSVSNKLPVSSPFGSVSDKLSEAKSDATSKLAGARKEGQQNLAQKDQTGIAAGTESKHDKKTSYSDTIDEKSDDIALRNDLSSKLDSILAATSRLKAGEVGSNISRANVAKNQYSSLKNSIKGKNDVQGQTIKTKLGIDSADKKDFLNEKTVYRPNDASGTKLKLSDGTFLDDYDFIVLKFQSKFTGNTVNFRAIVSGISETVSPSWDSAKFIGSPFHHYTYTGIERSVAFNFKVYSTTPIQHIAAWQRINFLTGLAYPASYQNGTAVNAPFVSFTMGNLYKNKACIIESLSYTIDDNTNWEIGSIGVEGNQSFKINGEVTSLDSYKLPKVIDVSITLKFVESSSNTQDRNYYGFDKLPRNKGAASNEDTVNAEKTTDLNTNETAGISLSSPTKPKTYPAPPAPEAPKIQENPELSQPAGASANNPGQSNTTTQTDKGIENSEAPSAPKPPQYKFIVDDLRIYSNGKNAFEGMVYADGTRILTREFSTVTYTKNEVEKALKNEAGTMGFTGTDGKSYPANPIYNN
jgi:hypothetical protein